MATTLHNQRHKLKITTSTGKQLELAPFEEREFKDIDRSTIYLHTMGNMSNVDGREIVLRVYVEAGEEVRSYARNSDPELPDFLVSSVTAHSMKHDHLFVYAVQARSSGIKLLRGIR